MNLGGKYLMNDLTKITGTFLDEITYDIPSQNWGVEEWKKDFDAMQKIGIDTVIIIRCGLGDRMAYPSKIIKREGNDDVAKIFLDETEKRGMKLFFGLYDSNNFWLRGNWKKEVEINYNIINEILERYGHYKSFYGWYIPQEVGKNDLNIIDIFTNIGKKCKELTPDKSILISPYYYGKRGIGIGENFLTLEEHIKHWNIIFKNISNIVDICAFQDGTLHPTELREWTKATRELCDKYNIKFWSNLETFARDMPIKFPPIDFRELKEKLLAVQGLVEKIITFEFSHFLSPNSIYPSAGNLYKRYIEFINKFNF